MREGYKQTEVGVIPESWEVIPITKATNEIFLGLTARVDYVESGGIPLVRATDIAKGKLSFDKARTISIQQHKKLTKYRRAKRGDVLVSKSGSLGVCAIVDTEQEFSIYESIIVLQANSSLDSNFLLSLIRDEQTQVRMIGEKVGSTVGHLNLEMFRKLVIPLPPLPEQCAIAQTLSDVDALIAALDKLIAKQRHLKTATMQQLLTGKNRLPGFGGEWAERQIGPEIDLLTGYPFPSAQYFDSGIKLLRGSNIKRGITDWSDDLVQYWPEITSDISHYVLHEGDIVVAMDGSLVGRSFARLSKGDLPALLLQRVARIRSEKIDMGYLKEWVCSKFFTEHCDAVKTVTAIPHISPGDIRSFTIQVPPTKEEQRAIATVLSDMDAAICALETRRAKTQAIKQGMMQQLLTGRVRMV